MKRAVAIWGSLVCLSCSESELSQLSLPLYVAGSDLSDGIVAEGDVVIELAEARAAFGPLYLCAGATAGGLCDTARLEWLDSVVVDLMEESPALAGELHGVSGEVRSWMFDWGISSQLTQGDPFILDAASELHGASLVVRGRATLGSASVPFRVSIPIQQSDSTERGVPVVRKSTSDVFLHDVTPSDSALLIRFDAAAWIQKLNLHSYLQDSSCSEGDLAFACSGTIEEECHADDSANSMRDCAEFSQVCLRGTGCSEELVIDSESQAYRALRNALTSGKRPHFEWNYRSK